MRMYYILAKYASGIRKGKSTCAESRFVVSAGLSPMHLHEQRDGGQSSVTIAACAQTTRTWLKVTTVHSEEGSDLELAA